MLVTFNESTIPRRVGSVFLLPTITQLLTLHHSYDSICFFSIFRLTFYSPTFRKSIKTSLLSNFFPFSIKILWELNSWTLIGLSLISHWPLVDILKWNNWTLISPILTSKTEQRDIQKYLTKSTTYFYSFFWHNRKTVERLKEK